MLCLLLMLQARRTYVNFRPSQNLPLHQSSRVSAHTSHGHIPASWCCPTTIVGRQFNHSHKPQHTKIEVRKILPHISKSHKLAVCCHNLTSCLRSLSCLPISSWLVWEIAVVCILGEVSRVTTLELFNSSLQWRMKVFKAKYFVGVEGRSYAVGKGERFMVVYGITLAIIYLLCS